MRRSIVSAIAIAAIVSATLVSAPAASGAPPHAVTSDPAAAGSPGTHFLDHSKYLAGFNDAQWYEANVPFIDVPNSAIQDIYYYRWRTWKEHLRYTNPTDGWISTEFLDCCGYAAPYQAVNAAAGHQISEGRWVRDQSYLDDYTKFWLTGPGAGPKPATDGVNADTTDWAHEYSFWLASAAYGRAQVTGDYSQLVAMLPELERQYTGWDKQFNPDLGLYWSVPVWDAMEFSASSYRSSDPYHGGAGYRPTLNSYQYGDALAISRIATLAGDKSAATRFSGLAAGLKASMQKWLWDPTRNFYFAMARDNNPNHTLLDTREEIGYIPWAFGAADASDSAAWTQLTDPQGFAAPFGPTTAERRSPLFDFEAGNCCRWDGPSWPFSTSQTLTGLANQLDDGPATSAITRADYAKAVETYALTQFKNGKPYVAEAHDADTAKWIYDGANHSEDYNHSTFNDLVLSGLFGLRPQEGDSLRIQPLVPADWDHYAVENVPYHGRNVSVLWDRAGQTYGQGAGMRVYVDGKQVAFSPTVTTMTVRMRQVTADAPVRLVDDAANPLRQGFPKPITSYTWRNDDPWSAIDGKTWFTEVPENTRWTNYSSPNTQDSYGVDFGVKTPVSDIRWYGYDDGGGVRTAAGYRVQYFSGGQWIDVPGQTRQSPTSVGNGLNRVTFPAVVTSQVRLLFTNPPGAFVGVTEFQSWSESSRSASVQVGPLTGGGVVSVLGDTRMKVTVTNSGSHTLREVSASVAVPDGWTTRSLTMTRRGAVIRPGSAEVFTILVTPSADAAPGSEVSVVASASYQDGNRNPASTHRRDRAVVAFPVGPTDPVGTWTLDDGTGPIAHDSSGAGHDLTVTGTPNWVARSPGTALQFDGSTGFAQTSAPVVDTAGNFSVAAWVRLDSTGNFATAASQDGAGTSAFYLQYSKADDRFAFATGEGRALADVSPVVGRWYSLVGVHDANAGRYTLYVDGVAQALTHEQYPGVASTGPFAVGRALSQNRTADFWPGAIDQVQVWGRVLPATEIATLHAATG